MKAVLWTDTFQSAVVITAFKATIIKGTMDVDGVWTVLERNYHSGRLEFLVVDPDVRVMGLWPGLFEARVFSATLSTISSGLNSFSTILLRDVIGSFLQIKISDENNTILARVISVFFGLASFSAIFLIKHFPGVLEACISLFGMLGGSLLGLFSLRMFFPFTNSKGAVAGFITFLVLVLWMGFVQTLSKLHGTYNQAGTPKKETSTDQCPSKWLQANVTTDQKFIKKENFNRTSLADLSRTSIADFSQSSMQAISSSQMTVEQMGSSIKTVPENGRHCLLQHNYK